MKTNILIVGVGGQGTLLASRVLGNYSFLTGMDCKISEVHGMAQRGGSVVTHFVMDKKVYTPVIAEGEVDVLLAFEKLEAARYCHYLKQGGTIIYNEQEILPQSVVTGQAEYPQNLVEIMARKTQNIHSFDALKLAIEVGNVKCVNIIMLTKLCLILGFDESIFKEAIKLSVPKKLLELNLLAFERAKI